MARLRSKVHMHGESLRMDAHQTAKLFRRDRTVIVRHIRSIYAAKELDQRSTCAINVQIAADSKVRQIEFYNLAMAISVGYQVKSKHGTQFRIWATNVRNRHTLKGYSVNEVRLKELRQSLQLVQNVLNRHEVTSDVTKALLGVVTDYSYALELLDDYDNQCVSVSGTRKGRPKDISFEEAITVIDQLREKFGGSDLFGTEKNRILHRKDSTKRIANNTLVAMRLLIAESKPKEKEIIAKIVVNLVNAKN